VIGPGPGSGSRIFQYDEGLEIVGEGANSVVQLGWTANTSAPDSVTTIAMNYPGGGEGNVLIAVGNNATTVNYWLFDNTGALTLPGNLKLPSGGYILNSDDSIYGAGSSYSNVNVKAYTESMGFQNFGNVNVAALITTNGLTNYSNVNVIAYLAGNVSAGNVFASGTSGKLGYTNGGFVQQITANSNGVSLNTVTGNIQLMGINLGVNGIHTVSFTNNKLEETNMILVSHHSGGVSNFAVGAYYAAPSTAIIWIRNITGADTSTLTPMLKFALINAPGS
jgi:hypothetical protein